MLKQIFPLLFTLIFSINLFAQNDDIHKEISDIKLQIQEIKLLDTRDDKEKKIEKLEKDIKELEEKFNQNNIDKKEIDGKLEKTKDIVDRQDKRIENIGLGISIFGIIVTFFGILITIIVIYFVVKFEKMAEILAEKELKKWIENEAMREFEPKIKEIKELIKKAESEVSLFKEKAESTITIIEKKLLENKELTNEEKNEIKGDIKNIENKKEEDYTFSDRYKLFLFKYTKNEFEEALSIIEKILTLNLDDKDLVKILFAKGLTLSKMDGKEEKAIKVYDEIIEKFKESKENNILEQVANALYNKGLTLGEMDGKVEEAIKVYDELIEKFKESKENNILEQVAKALYNKGLTLGEMDGKVEESIKVYDELIEKFKESKENNILEQVANALLNKMEMNLILGNTNSKEDLDLFLNLVKENKEGLLQFEILKILEKAKDSNQDEEIKNWQIEFKDVELGDWSFKELKTWAETLEEKPKKRVLRYIDIFEKHKSLE
ncbi:tetratricopeptide repeat protein [Aliarcobacter butzleri]|uniref:tetratricopeptide repeat protein n=1 Tax=Aliarcobacter butzleri TaxID=28197 RepID=UPI002B24063F|nr:tetratricopeptide repeat protein [Aliarcobacter butzleri]